MAKGNLFLGNGRGSVGDVTLSVLNGKQLSRRRARVVANPQSSSQQLQRMVMSTVTGNAARLRSLISHSFQGVRAGADSYNYFNRVNLRLLRSQAVSGQIQGYRIKGAETFVPCEGMILGKGIITAPTIEVADNGVIINNAFMPATFQNEQGYLNSLASTFNAEPGDEIAILFVRQTPAIAAEYDGFYQFKCELAVRRLVFLPWDPAFADQSLLVQGAFRTINTALLDYSIGGDGKPRTLDQSLQAEAPGTGQLKMFISNENTYRAGAVFVSRTDGQGGWYNSNTVLVVNSSVYYKQDEVTAADIQGSYGPAAAQEPMSDYYLEQSVSEQAPGFVPTIVAAEASSQSTTWSDLVSVSELVDGTIEVTKPTLSSTGVSIGTNFIPASVRVISGEFDTFSRERVIWSDIPAGNAVTSVKISFTADNATFEVELKDEDGNSVILEIEALQP